MFIASSQLIQPKKGCDLTSSASPFPEPNLLAGFLCKSLNSILINYFMRIADIIIYVKKLQLLTKILHHLIVMKVVLKELFLCFEKVHLYILINFSLI